MNDLLSKYFNIDYKIENNEVTKLSIKIKPDKLPKKKSSSNGSSINWYIDKFGSDLGKKIYNVRRRFNSSNEIVNYLVNTDIPSKDKDILLEYKDKKDKKRKISNKKTYSNPEFLSEFIDIVNKKERIEKISKKSKQMWQDAKKNNKNLYYRMINSSKHKNYTIDSVDMNYIEYQIATVLNEFNIYWEYEKIFNIDSHTYLPDFYCEKYKLVLECYGDFWHANPDIIGDRTYTHSSRLVEDVWEYDRIKKNRFEKNGFEFMYFWENDILNDLSKIEQQIKNKINELD